MSLAFNCGKKRIAERKPVHILCVISSSTIGHQDARMLDITRYGCRIALHRRFHPGDFVMVTVPTLGPIGARVAWSQGSMSGLRFMRPLSSTVVTLLCQRHATVAEAA